MAKNPDSLVAPIQKEITQEVFLHRENGVLEREAIGWSRKPGVVKYDRQRLLLKQPRWRLKEWDYYAILTPQYGISFTL